MLNLLNSFKKLNSLNRFTSAADSESRRLQRNALRFDALDLFRLTPQLRFFPHYKRSDSSLAAKMFYHRAH